MSNFDDEDLEIEAIAKCAKALSRLDNESKTRVISLFTRQIWFY